MATGRNDPCPCGSGAKYKNCCIEKDRRRGTPRSVLFILTAIAGIGLAVAIAERNGDDDERRRGPAQAAPGQAQNARPSTPQPQPPGPAPAGKVWSAEHGHWHDAAPAGAQPTKENPITVNRRNIPQPPGPVPEGKVWSPDHGHWHTKKKSQ